MFKVPWSSGYGKVTKAWEDAEKMLSEQRGRDGNLIYNLPISAKVIKDHFKVLLKWIKTDQLATTYMSGVDYEPPPGEMMQLMEEISELYTKFEDNKEETGKEKAAG